MTAARPATRPRRTRARDLPRGEWERLVRERPFTRPPLVPPPLHMLGRRRELQELRRLAETPPEPPGPDDTTTERTEA